MYVNDGPLGSSKARLELPASQRVAARGTPLMSACTATRPYDITEIARILLDAGADVNARMPDGESTLMASAYAPIDE